MQVNFPYTPFSGGTNLGEEAEEVRVCENKKEDDGAQINNLVELGFLKIFYLICLTWKKAEVVVLVGIIIWHEKSKCAF